MKKCQKAAIVAVSALFLSAPTQKAEAGWWEDLKGTFKDFTQKDTEELKEDGKELWNNAKEKGKKALNYVANRIESKNYRVDDSKNFWGFESGFPTHVEFNNLGLKPTLKFVHDDGHNRHEVRGWEYFSPILFNSKWYFSGILSDKPVKCTDDGMNGGKLHYLHNQAYYVEAQAYHDGIWHTLPIPVTYEDFLKLKNGGEYSVGEKITPIWDR